MKNPLRSDVWLVDLGMIGKVRPCLVVSTVPADHDRALFSVIPHTTSSRSTDFEVSIPQRYLDPDGVFDAQNIVSVPLGKFLRRLGTLSSSEMSIVDDLLRQWLGL